MSLQAKAKSLSIACKVVMLKLKVVMNEEHVVIIKYGLLSSICILLWNEIMLLCSIFVVYMKPFIMIILCLVLIKLTVVACKKNLNVFHGKLWSS